MFKNIGYGFMSRTVENDFKSFRHKYHKNDLKIWMNKDQDFSSLLLLVDKITHLQIIYPYDKFEFYID